MYKVKPVDFAATNPDGKGHLLLGNGFSRALREDIFSYQALFESADFGSLGTAKKAFGLLKTTDFETVVRALRNAAVLLNAYAPGNNKLRAQLENDADALRDLLASTIAKNHPERPTDFSDKQFESCRRFLSRFRYIYSLNYDLLLYWALMHEDGSTVNIVCDDGFRTPDDGPCEYVTWDIEKTNQQNIHYLHGALHIFDAGVELKKFTWINTGLRLIEQVRSALESDMYPLIVAEGESSQKLARILHSNYLSRAYRSFANIRGTLTIFGHAMSTADDHILHLIEKGHVSTIWVGLYGDPRSAGNQHIIQRATQLSSARTHSPSLKVQFFDASSAKVWG